MKIPYDIEAEYRLLGGILKSIDWANAAFAALSAAHLYCPKNREIFDSMRLLYESDRPVTLETVSLTNGLREAKLEDLINVFSFGNTSLFAEDFIATIKECHFKRELQAIATATIEHAGSKDSFIDVLRKTEEKLFSLGFGTIKKTLRPISEILESPIPYLQTLQERQQRLMDGLSSFDGIPTFFRDLDAKIRGLIPGHFTIVGARPGVGKTTFLLNLIENLCFKANAKCLFFSLEMPSKEIVEKLLSQLSQIPFSRLIKGDISSDDYQRIVVVANAWKKKCLVVEDQPSLGIDQVKARAIRCQRSYGIQAIFVDYIQLVTSKNKEARHLEVADISRKCKEIAKELNVPVVALAQLNRNVENREGKCPYISDLRESGSLEADADEIILLNRPEQFDANTKPGLMEIHIAKNRFGPTGQFDMVFDKHTGSLKDYYRGPS